RLRGSFSLLRWLRRLSQLCFDLPQLFGRKLLGIDQSEYEPLGRAAEETRDEIGEQLAGGLLTRRECEVAVRLVLDVVGHQPGPLHVLEQPEDRRVGQRMISVQEVE